MGLIMAQETTAEKITRLEGELSEVRVQIKDAQESANLNAFGRSVTRANLETLYKREREIEGKLDVLYATNQTGGLKYVRFRF